MAPKKKVTGLIKLQIKAGAANPAPPIGPALGQHGVNIMEFCKQYNAATQQNTGTVVPVEITDGIRPGVVSLPHGWGHDLPGSRLDVAARHAGVNSNLLADDLAVEALTGTAILNGIPVELAPA